MARDVEAEQAAGPANRPLHPLGTVPEPVAGRRGSAARRRQGALAARRTAGRRAGAAWRGPRDPNSHVYGKVAVRCPHDRNSERPAETARLLRIQEVADEVGLTARSVRYYEELGLLKPAARSEGDYRLYDETDVERLRFIKGLRDDAGFSLAEIAQLLEDEAARERGHAAYHATTDPAERKRILCERVVSYGRQIDTLKRKIDRLQAMVDEPRPGAPERWQDRGDRVGRTMLSRRREAVR